MLIETFCWYLWWFVALIDDWFIPIGCLDIETECTAGSVAISWGTVEQYITVPCSTIQSSQLIHAHKAISGLCWQAPAWWIQTSWQCTQGTPEESAFNCYIDSCCHQSAHRSYVVCGRAFSKAGYSWCSILAQVCTRFERSCGLEHQNVYNVRCPIPLPMAPWSIHHESIVYQNPFRIHCL